MSDVGMHHYEKIAYSLVNANRLDSPLFPKLEKHIIDNMHLDYDTLTMVKILSYFSSANKGSNEFYDSMQYIIFKGHLFNNNFFI